MIKSTLTSIITIRPAYGMLAALVVLSMALSFAPQKAQAWSKDSYPPRCAVPAALNGWDYKSKVREVWPAWNPDTVQRAMIIYETWGTNSQYPQTVFAMGDEIRFTADDDGNFSVLRTITTSGGISPTWPYRDKIGTANDSPYFKGFYFSSNPAETNFYHTLGNFNGTAVSNETNTPILTTYSPTYQNGSVKCIASAINVKYDALYTLPRYDALAVNNGLGVTDQCDQSWTQAPDKIGCYLRKSIGAVGDAITQAAKDVANGIATVFTWAFIPDEQEVSDLVGATQTFFEEKLGFLLYPFDFVIDLFAVFTSPPSNWCSSSSCVLSAGSIYGGAANFQIDVLAMKNMSETLWNLMTFLARTGLVVALIAGIHRKFEEVTQK